MISLWETSRISFRALAVNKMRSALTMLGIIIGVMAVIMMFAVGSGANREISDRFSSMGSNLLTVRPGAGQAPGGVRSGSVNTLTADDARAIADECMAVATQPPSTEAAPRSSTATRTGPPRSRGRRPITSSSRTGRWDRARSSPTRTSGAPPRSASWGRPSWTTSSAGRTRSEKPCGSGTCPW